MNKSLKNSLCTALLFAATALFLPATATNSATTKANVGNNSYEQGAVTTAKVDSTTYSVTWNGKATLYIDFYGENIVRLYQDPSGAERHDPIATPPAQILVDNARRSPRNITESEAGGKYILKTPRMTVTVSEADGCIDINGRVQMTCPVAFEKGKTTITLNCKDDEYFYGGGVQNGRFSHRGKSIAIENTNIWSDGGVASPTPFYWSTRGYGFMWHTFKAGRYDFGETKQGNVILSHNTDYLRHTGRTLRRFLPAYRESGPASKIWILRGTSQCL